MSWGANESKLSECQPQIPGSALPARRGGRFACSASPARTDGGLAVANFRDSCYKIDMKEATETFNGLELSESVLARDWNSPEEDAAWASL